LRKQVTIVNKYDIIIILIVILNGGCSRATLDKNSGMPTEVDFAKGEYVCSSDESIINSLHVKAFDAATPGLLNSMGVKSLSNHELRLIGATRVSGYCADHIDEFRTPIIHFGTGVTLMIDQERLSPYPKKYHPRNLIEVTDSHPMISTHKFIQAVDIGGGHESKASMTNFIGVWHKDGHSIITPYRKNDSGDFYVHNALFELDKPVVGIQFFHHLDTPSGLIQLLQKDGDDRILLEFIWVYKRLFSDNAM